MYVVDSSLRYVAAQRANVVTVYASLNKPYLAVPGKQAQESQAFISCLRNAKGTFSIFVTLYLTETGDLVHYTDAEGLDILFNKYRDAEAEALGFVESMGFILEDLNFRGLSQDHQENLLKTLPPFAEGPKAAARTAQPDKDSAAASQATKLARLFAAF